MPVPSNFIRWTQALPKEIRPKYSSNRGIKVERVDHEPRERKTGLTNTYKRIRYIFVYILLYSYTLYII